jgi:AcrR family transcriptional regulator
VRPVPAVGIEHHSGRYLDASRDAVLRETALALLAEVGYDRLTMDAVAARAHAGKTTIYRRWSGKADLVVDALKYAESSLEFPDTGSLRGDLQAVAASITNADNQFDAQVTIGIVTALAHDAELRQVFRERLFEPRMLGLRRVFSRAVARGEIPHDRNLDLLALLIPALALQHLMTSGEMPEAQLAQLIMDDVIFPLATAPARTPNPLSPAPSAEQASGRP